MFELSRQLKAAGKRLGPTVIINEFKALDGLDASVKVFRVKVGEGRAEPDPFGFKNQYFSPQAWFDEWWPALSAGARPGVYLKWHNELRWRGLWAQRIAWERAFMDLCAAKGLHILYGNFPVAGLDADAIEALVPMVEQGAQQGHMLCGNTYWYASAATAEAMFTYMLQLVRKVPYAPWMHGELGFGDNDAAYAGRAPLEALLANHARCFGQDAGAYEGGALYGENGAGGNWPHSNIPREDFDVIVKASG